MAEKCTRGHCIVPTLLLSAISRKRRAWPQLSKVSDNKGCRYQRVDDRFLLVYMRRLQLVSFSPLSKVQPQRSYMTQGDGECPQTTLIGLSGEPEGKQFADL